MEQLQKQIIDLTEQLEQLSFLCRGKFRDKRWRFFKS